MILLIYAGLILLCINTACGQKIEEFPPTFSSTKSPSIAWTFGNGPGNISCNPEAVPEATIKWRQGGIEIEGSSNYRIIGASSKSNLIITPNNEKKFYTRYECVATNKHGSASLFTFLRPATPPRMIENVKVKNITSSSIEFDIVPPRVFVGLPLKTINVLYKHMGASWETSKEHTWIFGTPYVLDDLTAGETYEFHFAASNEVGMGPWMSNIYASTLKTSE